MRRRLVVVVVVAVAEGQVEAVAEAGAEVGGEVEHFDLAVGGARRQVGRVGGVEGRAVVVDADDRAS